MTTAKHLPDFECYEMTHFNTLTHICMYNDHSKTRLPNLHAIVFCFRLNKWHFKCLIYYITFAE